MYVILFSDEDPGKPYGGSTRFILLHICIQPVFCFYPGYLHSSDSYVSYLCQFVVK